GITEIDSAATAADALTPVAGVYAKYLFGIGLFGAAMLAMGVLPLATAYSLSEALGFEKGLSRTFREAPIFLGIFSSLIILGVIVALIPGIPQINSCSSPNASTAYCFRFCWSRSFLFPQTRRSWAITPTVGSSKALRGSSR
ncbi:MAG TPA: divalent metal cation transporter, partial [Pyrinomonadaceae bacterium]|nr:divalent metal cation transporter [Pyrinomonadaceae bacterium]